VQGGDNLFTLTIKVTDAGGLSTSSNTVLIHLTDSNDYPVWQTLPALSVNENAAAGTVVATVMADDSDFLSQKLT